MKIVLELAELSGYMDEVVLRILKDKGIDLKEKELQFNCVTDELNFIYDVVKE
jgi:hypothetical protein